MGWVILTDDHPPAVGGVATWTLWAAEALASRGPVDVWCRARPHLVEPAGVRLHGVTVRSFAKRGPLAMAWHARQHLQRADGVLCTTWPMARFASRLVPVHVVGHGSDLVRPRDPAGLRRVWRRCAHRWTVSEHLARVARSRGLHANVLPTPIAPRPHGPLGTRWVFVGRALTGKGGARFVRWVAEAGVAADVVGDGPALPVWRSLAQRLGADVRFHGELDRAAVDDVLDDAAAVFLLSTRVASEGLGLTLLEARARGISVVGSRSGGIAEAVGREGLLVRANTTAREVVEWLATADRPTLSDPRAAFLSALGA